MTAISVTTTTVRKSWEIRMRWRRAAEYRGSPIWGEGADRLSGSNGVYELADENFNILYVGYAGSRAIYGLRGKIVAHLSDREPNAHLLSKVVYFRYEVTSSYLSRWTEVVGRYHEAGRMPVVNSQLREFPRHMPYFGPPDETH